jgi:ribonuclease-3
VIEKEFDNQTDEIERILGYQFADQSLLLTALTRRSFWHENRETCSNHNERMEFLGDAVLGLVIAEALYRRFPTDEEGELQKKRAGMVNRAALAKIMRQLGLAHCIRMGKGDEMSGCRDLDSILADTLEALLAAVYLDGGFDRAAEVIQSHFHPLIEKSAANKVVDDFRTVLQEQVQAEQGVTPHYEVVEEWGEDHRKTFVVAVYRGEELTGQGMGKNKREAAQNAARDALEKLGAAPDR